MVLQEIYGGAEYTGRLEGPTVVDDEVERVEDIAVPVDQISRVVEVEIERSGDEEGGDVIDEVDNEEEGSEQSLADASELAVGIGGNRVASQDHNEASSMKEGSDDDAEVGLDRVCDASEDDAAEDNEMFLAATNALHDAIDVGTLTEEDAHAIIDSATGDDGHVNVSMLTGIVDELQEVLPTRKSQVRRKTKHRVGRGLSVGAAAAESESDSDAESTFL